MKKHLWQKILCHACHKFPTFREGGFMVMERPSSYSFSIKYAYKKLANHGIEGVIELFAHLWNLKVMSSAQFNVWRAL